MPGYRSDLVERTHNIAFHNNRVKRWLHFRIRICNFCDSVTVLQFLMLREFKHGFFTVVKCVAQIFPDKAFIFKPGACPEHFVNVLK